MKMGVEAVKIHNESKHKERVPEVIEISSDSEIQVNMLDHQMTDPLNPGTY